MKSGEIKKNCGWCGKLFLTRADWVTLDIEEPPLFFYCSDGCSEEAIKARQIALYLKMSLKEKIPKIIAQFPNLDYSEVAKWLGISEEQVFEIATNFKKRNLRNVDREIESIVEKWKNGEQVKQIAKSFNCHSSIVQSKIRIYLLRQNVENRSP